MVKNKNYNHPEIGVLKEDDLVRMKVLSTCNSGNYSQAHQRRTRARASTGRGRERVQVVVGESQARGNVATGRREKEKDASR